MSPQKSGEETLAPGLFVPLEAEDGKGEASVLVSKQTQQTAPLPADSYSNATAEQSRFVEKIKQRRTTKSVSLTRLDVNALKENNVQMSLSSGKRLRVSKKHFEAKDANNFTWSGEIAGTFSMSTFVVHDGNVTGTIRDENNALYSIEPVGDGVHALIQIDEASFPPSAAPLRERMDSIGKAAYPMSADTSPNATPVEIDVLVAFTPAARRARNDMAALIHLAVAETNQSYQNSGINIWLNVVDSFEFNYTEPPASPAGTSETAKHKKWSDMLRDFATSQTVNDRRNASGADVAMLVVDHWDYCGMAYMLPTDPWAFGVVDYSCATGNYTFAHEIGHIQGAGHDEHEGRNPNYAYGHGYLHPSNTPSQNFRTIMAYDNASLCPPFVRCPRIQYWSNPSRSLSGIALGTTHTNNNARVLNETAARVAAFRARPPAPPPPPSAPVSAWLPVVLEFILD